MSEEGLPPLKSRQSPHSKFNEKSDSSENANNQHLKREVSRLYPRIQTIEKEISSIKNQIPVNLDKVMLQLRRGIDKLTGKINQEKENEGTGDILKERIDDLESRLNEHLELAIQSSNSSLEKKLQDLLKNQKKQFIFNLNSRQGQTFEEKLKHLEGMIKGQQENTKNRIEMIEKNLSTVVNASQRSDKFTQLDEITDGVEANGKELANLRSKLSDVRLQLDQQSIREQVLHQQSLITSGEMINTRVVFDHVPDLSVPIQKLTDKLMDLQKQYSEKIGNLKQRAAETNKRIKLVDQMTVEIMKSTATLELRITESDTLCKQLTEKLSELEKQTNSMQNPEYINSLTEKIANEHRKLQMELNDIKERALRCQEAVRNNY